MKITPALLFLAGAVATPDLRYFLFDRPVQLSAAHTPHTCLVADADLFAHAAAPDLADLRLYHNRAETPYLIQTSSVPLPDVDKPIHLLNLGVRDGQAVFDSEMPSSGYRDLAIEIAGRDFIAPVRISGSQTQAGPKTQIGQFTIFDLTNQKLGRSTVLHLPESDFRFLHFVVGGHIPPKEITGLGIERVGTVSPAYVDVAAAETVGQKGTTTFAEFTVPAHVPVDRIEIVPESTPLNFSREVTVRAGANPSDPGGELSPQDISGFASVLRVHRMQDTERIDLEKLTVPTYRRQFNQTSHWTVTIENGDDAPLVPRQVKLQMFERDICFEASNVGDYTLYYGDAALNAPHYDFGQIVGFHLSSSVHATLGTEQRNREYEPRPDGRPFSDRHPSLLWITLILVLGVLGAVAYRTAQGIHSSTT